MGLPVEIQVLFCDSRLLVVNKPAGLSTLPDGYNPTLPHIKSQMEAQYGRLWIVHRLDKQTSGVLLLARTADAHRSLNTQFEQHRVVKVYHALVIGCPDWQEKTVDLPLQPNGDRHHRTLIDRQAGKPAITHLKVLERLGAYCFVEAVPATGRTHQIRAHLTSQGLSILGDKLYAHTAERDSLQAKTAPRGEAEPDLYRAVGMALHARSLEFNHPIGGEQLKFEAPYPVEFERLLQQLRRTAVSSEP